MDIFEDLTRTILLAIAGVVFSSWIGSLMRSWAGSVMTALTLVFLWFCAIFYVGTITQIQSKEAQLQNLQSQIAALPDGPEQKKKEVERETTEYFLEKLRRQLNPANRAEATATFLVQKWPVTLAMTLVVLTLVSVIRIQRG